MLSATSLFVASVALLAASPAVADPASAHDVAVVVAQFNAAHIVPDVLPTFAPQGLLTLNFADSVGTASVGQNIPKANTATKPDLKISGTAEADAMSGGPFNASTTKYTALLMDGNYPGSTNDKGYNLHYLENDLAWGDNSNGSITLASGTGGPVIKYAGPGPAAGSGPHRYIMLVYPQPANFTAPTTPAKGGGVALFDLNQYKTASGLTSAVAGTYFVVEEGTATVSVEATSSVNPATVSAPSASGSATGTASGTGASASNTSKPNGAVRTSVGVGAGVIALAVAALFSL